MTTETRTRFYSRRAPGDLVFLVTVIIAVIIVGHIIFVLLDANGANDIVSTDSDWATWFSTWFLNLFTPSSYKLNVTLNYGLAALCYLLLGGILRRVIKDL